MCLNHIVGCCIAALMLILPVWTNASSEYEKQDLGSSTGRALHQGEGKNPDNINGLSTSQIERIKRIGIGWYDTEPTAADVPRVLQALTDTSCVTSSYACLAVEKMARKDLFDAQSAKLALRALLPKLRSVHEDTSEWSARAVGSLASHTKFVTGETLASVFAEALRMMEDKDPEYRCRGLALTGNLAQSQRPGEVEQTVIAVLAACRRPIRDSDAHRRAFLMGIGTLGTAARRVEDENLATEAARELLRALNGTLLLFGIREPVLVDTAHLARRIGEPVRSEIIRTVLAAAANETYVYFRTSSFYTPPRHAGADALVVIAPLLDKAMLERAMGVIPPRPRTSKLAELALPGRFAVPLAMGLRYYLDEYESMYGAALKVLAERQKQIEQRTEGVKRS